MNRGARVCVLAATLLWASTLSGPLVADDALTVLGVGGYWRAYATWDDPVVPLALLKEAVPDAAAPRDMGFPLRTAPPAADWTQPDFDDHQWYRSRGPIRPQGPTGPNTDAALMCLRGRFTVADPARVKALTFAASYAGGVVVSLNGREVARGHMPEGDPSPTTLALPYPKEAYVDGAGKVISHSSYQRAAAIKAGQTDLPDRVARRVRRLERIALPVDGLRKGVNVLAVAVHRSPYRPEAVRWSKAYGTTQGWPHIGLFRLVLTAEGADAVEPNTARPKGVQAWNQDPHATFGAAAYGDPREPLRPIRLVGARNGYYSGQVVVGSTAALKDLTAVVTDLKRSDAAGVIGADRVRVRYGGPSTMGIRAPGAGLDYRSYARPPAFATLLDVPPAVVKPTPLRPDAKARTALGLPPTLVPGAVQPVWVTVNVPPDAAPGRYEGALTVSADGIPDIRVPVTLDVIGWTLPDLRRARTIISVYQSPESVALQYGVPMWSDRHWALMERSFRLLGYVGNRLLMAPLVNRTQLGNDECLVPWIRQPDGSYTYDLANYDRLLGLAVKHCDITVLSHVVYLSHGWRAPGPEKPTFVTVVDPATKKREAMQLPPYNTPEAKRLWRPLFEAIRPILKKHGLDKATLVMGITQDGGVHKDVAAHFKAVFPEAGWHYGAHNRPRSRAGKAQFRFSEYMYVPHSIAPPTKVRRYGWKNTPLTLMSQRLYDERQPPLVCRTMPERALLLGDNGAGRMCLDYWPVTGSSRHGGRVSLFDRWPDSSSGQRCPHMSYLGFPGPDGAVATVKLEALREGLQEAEARVFIEERLVNGAITGRLAERCQALLDKRTNFCRILHSNIPPVRVTIDQGWQQRTADLYALAAEVAGNRPGNRR